MRERYPLADAIAGEREENAADFRWGGRGDEFEKTKSGDPKNHRENARDKMPLLFEESGEDGDEKAAQRKLITLYEHLYDVIEKEGANTGCC